MMDDVLVCMQKVATIGGLWSGRQMCARTHCPATKAGRWEDEDLTPCATCHFFISIYVLLESQKSFNLTEQMAEHMSHQKNIKTSTESIPFTLRHFSIIQFVRQPIENFVLVAYY